jgi:UDP-glucose 4-epimerase
VNAYANQSRGRGTGVFAGSRVLVTGGQGFIGSNLVLRLAAAKAEVTTLDCLASGSGGNAFNLPAGQGKVAISNVDLRDVDRLRALLPGHDYIFHLAAQISHAESMRDPLTDLDVNARATLGLLEACRDVNPRGRIVFTSTRQVYGTPQYLPVDELHPLAPPDVNAINKLAAEYFVRLYHRIHGTRANILRLTNTYGPRMRVRDARQTFVGFWIRLLLEGRQIEVFGDGSQKRDFNHVDDVVEALLLAASDGALGGVYNLGDKQPVTLRKLAECVVALRPGATYRCIEFPADRKAIDIGDYWGDYSAFSRATGWQPSVPLADGIRATADFFARHRSEYW